MKNSTVRSKPAMADKERPDYYITPSHDFTQYTKDCEEKYWNRETAFDWNQDVQLNLKENLERLGTEEFSALLFMVLPMILSKLDSTIEHIRVHHLPTDEDALNAMQECIPFGSNAIQKAIALRTPLKNLQESVSGLKDRSEILHRTLEELREQQRLGFFRKEVVVKPLETEAERQEQSLEIARVTSQKESLQKDLDRQLSVYKQMSKKLNADIQKELRALEPQLLLELEATQKLLQQTLDSRQEPKDPHTLMMLKDLVWKRQLRGLKDIANHSLVVEQSAIAPITMGVIHYKRHREIQEAMTLFINDEAKHSATFRRFLVEKLGAKEYISSTLIRGANRYMRITRFMPGTGFFMAVIVEAIGGAALEFFGNEKYMPDRLFRSICRTISEQDEKRHMDLCVAIYNELYRKGTRWERFRNNMALQLIMKAAYGNKTEDHHLIQAFRAFGIASDKFYHQIAYRLSQQLTRVGVYVEPDKFLRIIGQA